MGSLIVAGVTKPDGLYGAIGSTDPSDIELAAITGPGKVRVGAALSAFDQWALDNGLTGPDALPSADPDHDGDSNLDEFALSGNPASGSDSPGRFAKTADTNGDGVSELTLTIQVRSGASFTANNNDLIATVDGITCRIEGSLNLATFDSPVSEVTPHPGTGAPRAGYQFKTFRLDASNGAAGRGFLRVHVTAP